MLSAKRCGRMSRAHTGVAATELAICLPLVAMLILASIEACGMVYLNHSLAIASYEGARVAINYDSTNSEVNDKVDQMVAARNVADSHTLLSPSDVATVPRGTPITITLSAPCNSNALVPPWFFGGKTLSASTTMVKE